MDSKVLDFCSYSSASFYHEAGYNWHLKWMNARRQERPDLMKAESQRTSRKTASYDKMKRHIKQVLETMQESLELYQGRNFRRARRQVKSCQHPW